MDARFEQFIRERQYLTNVSPATLEWYKHSLKWLPTESPTEDELKGAVLRMREKGLKATGCNSAIRAINAYLHWSTAGADVKCSPACKHLRIPQLKEPQLILPTFTTAQVTRLVNWKPRAKVFWQRRLHLLILFLLDTGCRISEALALRVSEIDFDNLLLTLDGKGRKQRMVPFSFELKRALFRFVRDCARKPDALLLASKNETRLGRRVMLRDVKLLCRRLGFDPPGRTLHSFRHTFAVNYLRKGGSVFHLQKVLGHSTLEMTL
jgi:integrase/recombinase XerD